MKRNKIILIIILMIAFFIAGNVYASELTYKYKSDSRVDSLVIYKDGNQIELIETTRVDFGDLGLQNEGVLTESIVDKINDAQLQTYIEDLDDILNSSAYVSSVRNNKAIKDYLPSGNNKPTFNTTSRAYVKESILAYNCNSLKKIFTDAKNGGAFDKFEEFKVASNVSVTTTYESSFINGKVSEYNAIKNYYESASSTGILYKTTELSKELRGESSKYSANQQNNSQNNNQQNVGTVPATGPEATGTGNWWTDAQSFFNTAKSNGKDASAAKDLVDELSDMIFDIGNMIFIVVTSVLGVKYIFGSAEGKAQIKDSLITLIVAALFFYGWSAISNLLNIGGLLATGTLESTAAKIYNTVLFIVNLVAISGVIWIGVKYMLSSAEGKAEIKTSWGPLILGIVMVYATVWFLSTIVTAVLG